MTAGDVELADELLRIAKTIRAVAAKSEADARRATMRFIDAGLDAGWSWSQIGARLDISGTGARRYYQRNRRVVRPGAVTIK
jgi:hypothetical protein